ncbi:50S ribosomal protein L1, partial [Marinomonas arenicola]
LEALLTDLRRAKPASSKSVFMKKVVLASTMGPGLQIDLGALTSTK